MALADALLKAAQAAKTAGVFATGVTGGMLKANLPGSLLLGGLGAKTTFDVLGDLTDKVVHSGKRTDQAIQGAYAYQDLMRGRQLEQQRVAAARQMNQQILMRMNPHLYNELLIGRKLPMGAFPVGVEPRTDLLDLFTDRMTSGGGAPDQSQGGGFNPLGS